MDRQYECTIHKLTNNWKGPYIVTIARSHIFQGKPYGVTWCLMTSLPVMSHHVAMLLPVAHAHTSPFQWNPFGVTWRLMTSLQVNSPNREDIAQHAITLVPVTWCLVTSLPVTSHPVTMSVMHNGTFCTTTIVRKKTRGEIRACAEHSSGHGHFRWRHPRSRPSLPVIRNGPIPPKYGLNRPNILLTSHSKYQNA